MDLYEYQGKQLFQRHGIPVSDGRLAPRPRRRALPREELGGPSWSRRRCSPEDAERQAGSSWRRRPTRPRPRRARSSGSTSAVTSCAGSGSSAPRDIAREYYLSVTFDRGEKKPLFMFTTEGGVDIEEVAATKPEALVRLHVDPLEGFQPWQARRLVYGGGSRMRASRSRSPRSSSASTPRSSKPTRCSARSTR